MRNDSAANEAKNIWQNEPTEVSRMTSLLLQQKLRALHNKTRYELLRNIAVPLFVIGIAAFGLTQASEPPQKLIFALTIAWALAGQYFLNRGLWSGMLPGDAGLHTGIEFYRQEVERRHHLFRRALPWSFGPIVLAVGGFFWPIARTIIAKPELLSKALPVSLLLLLWIVTVLVLRLRQQRELRREIDELNAIEREQRTGK